jgi:hypothetical protein
MKVKKPKKNVVKNVTKKVATPEPVLPLVAQPNSWYWALFYNTPEIVLTTSSAQYFYLHGDEHIRAIGLVKLIKFLGSRDEAVRKIQKGKEKA